MELKPCPFCKIGKVDVKGGGDTYLYFTRCRKCGALGPSAQTESGAIEAWNTRPEVDTICNWTPRKDELGYVTWTTTCWETVQDVDLGLGSEFPYCPYCGKKAVWGVIKSSPAKG